MPAETFISTTIEPIAFYITLAFIVWHCIRALRQRYQESQARVQAVQQAETMLREQEMFPDDYSAVVEAEQLWRMYWDTWEEQVRDE